MADCCTGTMSVRGEELIIMPPGCWARYLGNPSSWADSSMRSRHTGESVLSRNSGNDSISSSSSRALWESTRLASLSTSWLGSPNALPRSRMAPFIL